jgi:hypothetical protein
MEGQVKAVAILNLVSGILAAIAAVFVLFTFGVGTVATQSTTRDGTPGWVPGVVAGLGLIIGILFALIGATAIAAGIMLLQKKPAGKLWGIIASVLHIINLVFFPFSMAIGIYGLIVLVHRDTERLLAAPA